MRVSVGCLLALVMATSLVAPSTSVLAQSSEPTRDGEVLLGTTEVTLDVVARDRRGKPVTNLDEVDLTIAEDGVPQEITSFRLVRPSALPAAGGPAAGAPASAASAGAAPEGRSLTTAPEDSKAIALVFDSLSFDARPFAYSQAKKYLEKNLRPGDAVGVFVIGYSLVSLQAYTTDRDAILAAVDLASKTAGPSFNSERTRIQTIQGTSTAGVPSTDVQSTISTPGQRDEPRGPDRGLREIQSRTIQGFDRLQRQQQGLATTNALLGVVEGLSLLPGRKALLFFSQGVQRPWAAERSFQSVISNANRARVSIYPVDVAGLSIGSPYSGGTSADINSYGRRRAEELGSQAETTNGSLLVGFEGLETSLRSNPRVSLGKLAKETGGYLIADTNGIAERLGQVDEDLRTYYVVTYVPKNQNYDGSFRRVAVSARRSGVSVRTREGYYAINVASAPPVLAYEAPAVAAATARTPRADFPIRSLAASFPEPERPGLAPVIVSVPASSATFMRNAKKKTFATAFSVVVLARDEAGQIVAKTSKEYVLTGPLDQLETTKQGDLLYYDELDLPPGRYVVDAVAYDAPSRKASVRRMPLVVAPVEGGGPRLSSVTIVDRAEQFARVAGASGEPFHVGNTLLYPNLGTPVQRAQDAKLAFYVTAYVEKGSLAPEATVEVMQNGRSLRQLPVELPAPDDAGRIRYTNAFSLDAFPPGSYELRVTVTDGTHTAARSTRFTVVG